MKRTITIALVLCIGQQAQAGAWLREQGSGFFSFSLGTTENKQATSTAYLEYGMWETTTVGLDINGFDGGSEARNASGVLFLRRALGRPDWESKLSYELGVGARWENDQTRPIAEATLSWGRGFQIDARNGWVNLDLGYIHDPDGLDHTTKFDATAGFDFTSLTTGIVEFTYSEGQTDSFGAFEPSVLLKPRRTEFQIKLGAQIPIDEEDSTALKLGLWREF